MTYNRPSTLLLLLLLFLWQGLPAKADGLGYSKGHPLIIGLDADYAPMEYINEDGMPSGLDVDFTHELMERMNVTYIYQPNTWENISGDVINGRVDLGMMVYSPYRKDLVNYSRAVLRLYYQIVYRKEEKGRFDVRNLGDKEIAFMASRPITDTLTKVGARLNVVTDLPLAMRELNSGRYDAVICFRYQAKYLIPTYGLTNLTTYDLTLTPREYCYVSRNKQLIDSINVYLEQMEADGVMREVYGNVTSQFDTFEIPQWVYWVSALFVIVFLMVLVILQHRHQKRLRLAMERAQRSERLKSVFLGNVSHALRTPLNSIIGFNDLLLSEAFDEVPLEERKNLLLLINKNGNQLLHFIDELLQLSNIETSQRELTLVDCNVSDLLTECCEDVSHLVQEGVEIRCPKDSLVLKLDAGYLRTLITHLLRNAAQHTKEGCIEVKYGVVDDGLFIDVADTGEGLPESLRENIFALLSDANTYVQDETPGLGLSICKGIVDMLRGKISAQSETGKGTTIQVWTPLNI